jgi:hypothetical protein
VSLLLCLATAGLWVRSYFFSDRYQRVTVPAAGQGGRTAIYIVQTFKGEIGGAFMVVEPPRPGDPPVMQMDYEQARRRLEMRGRNPRRWSTSPPRAVDAELRWGGFGYAPYGSAASESGRSVIVPLWALTLLFSCCRCSGSWPDGGAQSRRTGAPPADTASQATPAACVRNVASRS